MAGDATTGREQRQTTLREILALVLLFAVAFAVLRTTPLALAAGLLGVLTFAMQIWLLCTRAPRLVMHLAWWSMLAMYAVAVVWALRKP
ncbi:MAG: hypothetical protein HYS13_07325 [Planctomycetia bacterium]|nr:hypothetical protein [Planctomycetia bacterium]